MVQSHNFGKLIFNVPVTISELLGSYKCLLRNLDFEILTPPVVKSTRKGRKMKKFISWRQYVQKSPIKKV